MAKKASNYRVSEAELEILQVLWSERACTVRKIHEQLLAQKEVGYTTVLKQLQRMFDKNLVKRRKEGKLHYYEAVPSEDQVQKTMYNKLLNTAFKGSAMKLVMHALGNSKASAEEIDALQKWLDQQKKKK